MGPDSADREGLPTIPLPTANRLPPAYARCRPVSRMIRPGFPYPASLAAPLGREAGPHSGTPTAPTGPTPTGRPVSRFDPVPEAKPLASGRMMLHRVDHHHRFRGIGSQRSPALLRSERSDLPRLSRWERPRVEGGWKLQGSGGVPRLPAHTYNIAKVRTSRCWSFLVSFGGASGRS